MPGTITNPKTWGPLHDYLGAPGNVRQMAFRRGDGNIYIAIVNDTLLSLVKATGVQNFATFGNSLQVGLCYDNSHDQFISTPGSGGNNLTRFTGAGALIDNPASGANPYGIIPAETFGSVYAGDTGDTFASVHDLATGALTTSIDTTITGVTTFVGQAVFDGASVWMTAVNSELFQFDAATATLVNTFDLTGQGIGRIGGICFDGANLWISDFFGFKIAKLDLAGNVLATFSTFSCGGNGPMAFDGTYLWVLDFGGCVSVYDLSGTQLATAAGIAGAASAIAVDPADGPGFCWVSSGTVPSQVQQFKYNPPAPPAQTGIFHGTFVGFGESGRSSGGTK